MSLVVPFLFIEIFTIFNLKCSFDLIFQDYHFETCHKIEIPSALKKQTKKCFGGAKLYML